MQITSVTRSISTCTCAVHSLEIQCPDSGEREIQYSRFSAARIISGEVYKLFDPAFYFSQGYIAAMQGDATICSSGHDVEIGSNAELPLSHRGLG